MGYSQGYHGTFTYETREARDAAMAAADATLREESSIGLDMLVKSLPSEIDVMIRADLNAPASLAYKIEAALYKLAEHAVDGCVVCKFEGDDDTAVCAGDHY
jgi:hypothetical protein